MNKRFADFAIDVLAWMNALIFISRLRATRP
jgi:hypothetical protein